jgi:prephenate dehydratase
MTRVAIQGEAGSFSEDAAIKHFGKIGLLTCRTFEDVAIALEDDLADYAVIPEENRIAGLVVSAQPIIQRPDFRRIAEVEVPVQLCVLAAGSTPVTSFHSALSHPVALAQCRKFFTAHPALHPVEWYDTAGAARHVARLADPGVSAIAGRSAAERYKLDIIVADIQDRADNSTRFVVLSRG